MKKLQRLSVNHAPWPVVIRHAAENKAVSGLCQAVSGRFSYLARRNSLTIIHLPHSASAVSAVSAVSGVFKFVLGLVSNTVLFSKMNFNSKLPDTADTDLWNYYKTSLFVVEHLTQRPFLADTDLTQEGLFLTQTKNIELNVSHKSRISNTMSTNHGNRLTLRVHRSFWRSL
jgi:hypothetical protein